MKLRFFKRILMIAAVLLACGILAAVFFFSVPAPPPKVSLVFKGFDPSATNTAALVSFTNEGKQAVWWDDSFKVTYKDGDAEKAGAGTVQYTGWPSSTKPGGSFTMPVNLPVSYSTWRISTGYVYYNRYPTKIMFMQWYLDSKALEPRHPRLKFAIFRTCVWILDLFPQPKPQMAEVSTPFLTNQPAAIVH